MLLTPEQRRQQVNSTDVAAILGVNPYQTAEEVRLIKRGVLPEFEGNDISELGELLQPVVAVQGQKYFGFKARHLQHIKRRKEYPWLAAHIDYNVIGQKAVHEIKTSAPYNAKNWGQVDTDEIPQFILPQVHTQLLLWDYEKAYVSVFFSINNIKHYVVNRDKEIDNLILNETKAFWEYHVLQDKPCSVKDWSTPGAHELISKLYPETDGTFKRLDLDHPANAWRDQYEQLGRQISDLKKQQDAIKNKLLNTIGNSAGCIFADNSGLERRLIYKPEHIVKASKYYVLKENKHLGVKAMMFGE